MGAQRSTPEDAYPRCVEVMRVSVLSLEGVSNRLWAGSRNGMISAYHQALVGITNCASWSTSNEVDG